LLAVLIAALCAYVWLAENADVKMTQQIAGREITRLQSVRQHAEHAMWSLCKAKVDNLSMIPLTLPVIFVTSPQAYAQRLPLSPSVCFIT